jgi:hypothetical protein
MATLFQVLQFFDANGAPLSGGKVFWYEAGTSTKKETWRDQGEVSEHTNPIILNNDGTIPDGSGGRGGIWLRGSYKLVIAPSTDTDPPTNPIITQDVINEYDQRDWTGLTASIADLNSTTTSTLSKNDTYTVALANRNKTILANATTKAFTINLPAAATVGNTFRIWIKKVDVTTNAVTINAVTIDGQTNFELNDYNDFVGLQSNGSNWYLISSQVRGTTLAKSLAYTLTLNDNTKLVLADASGGAFNLTLPSAVAVGRGYAIAIKKTDATTNGVTLVTAGAETIDGAASYVISSQFNSVNIVTDGTNWFIKTSHRSAASAPFPRGYFYSAETENDSGDLSHDIKFKVGAMRDEDNTVNMILTSPLIKKIDQTWAQGTGQGGMADGVSLEANKCYHMFWIAKPDGTTDCGLDEEGDLDANKLLGGATGFTTYRRIGSVLTDSSLNIRAFYNKGNYYYWNTTNFTTLTDVSGVYVNQEISIPKDVITRVFISGVANVPNSTSLRVYLQNIDALGAPDTQILLNEAAAGGDQAAAGTGGEVMSNKSAQIRFKCVRVGSATWTGYPYAWEELRTVKE